MCKKIYNCSLENCKKKILRIINEWKIKYRFKLVVKLITNKYYIDLFCYLFYPLLVILSRLVDFI